MNAPGEPVSAPSEDTLTIAPPLPPLRVDMRFTASRAQSNCPATLTRIVSMMPANVRVFDPALGTAGDPGIVDQTGQRAEDAVGLGEQSQNVVLIADVALYGDGLPAGGLDVAHHRVRFGLGVAIVDDDATPSRARAGARLRRRCRGFRP